MDDEAPVVRYEASAGAVRVRLAGGEEVVISGLGAEVPFWRHGPADALSAPLWLTAGQAEVLEKMIGYILDRVRIHPNSQQILEGLRPLVGQLRDELADAAGTPIADVPPPDVDED
jgi:hypothetical protein